MNLYRKALRQSCALSLGGLFLAALPLAAQHAPGSLPDQPRPSSFAEDPASASSPEAAQQTAEQSTAETREERQRRAAEELKRQERQRILGVLPNFNSTDNAHAAPLTAHQKFQLTFRSSTDPFIFVTAALDAAEEQAQNTFAGYGQGFAGYAKRFGASYADTADGNLWGNAILPTLLHEDPRYFRRGVGSFWSRALYSASTNIWNRRDNATWGPNFSNIGGNFIAGGIANLYYPSSDRGLSLTVTRALTVTAEGAIGSELIEFWPDVSQRLFHRRERMPRNRTVVPPEGTKPAEQTAPPVTPRS